jgi:membrane protein
MRRYLEIVLDWVRHGFDDGLLQSASSLAYSTLLAIVPLVTVVLAVLSLFPVFEDWTSTVEAYIFNNFVPATGEVVSEYFHEFSAQVSQLTGAGIIMLLVTALLLLANIENALNRIWGVKTGRSAGQRIVVYWTLITLGPIMMVGSLAISSVLLTDTLPVGAGEGGFGLDFFLPVLPFLLEFTAFAVMYYVVPNCPTRFVNSMIGAGIAAVLFEVAKSAFAAYVSEFKSYEVIYGALWVIPVFLIWIYISWLVVLIGGRYAARLDSAQARGPSDSA